MWISDFSSLPIGIVEAVKATTPASNQGSGQAGSTIVIPVPVGTKAGHVLIAVLAGASGVTSITDPPGWTRVSTTPGFGMTGFSYRIASAHEPASYTWTIAPADYGRSGCMIALKGGQIDTIAYQANTKACPSVTNSKPGAILVGLHAGLASGTADTTTANPPLQMRAQHNAVGTVTYSLRVMTAIAVEEGLQVGPISGRTFVDAGVADFGRDTMSILVRPGN